MSCCWLNNQDLPNYLLVTVMYFVTPSQWTELKSLRIFFSLNLLLNCIFSAIYFWLERKLYKLLLFCTMYNWISMVHQVQLLIYFMLKYAMEILLSESSVITTYYFQWSTSTVAIFLACLGLTVLPINIVVGNYISNMFEDR